jgi:hypothetical protein
MSDLVTLLDAAHAAVSADPQNDALRLRFYERLADGEMILLLEREVEGDQVTPRVFPLEGGPVVLIFDREERLSAFSGGIAPYAALPGRVIAGMLKGQGIGLGVNLGVAPSSMLLPPEALDWLAMALETGPQVAEGKPEAFHAPKGLPEALLTGLDAKLARAAGLASGALLAGVTYADGRRGHMLAFLDAAPGRWCFRAWRRGSWTWPFWWRAGRWRKRWHARPCGSICRSRRYPKGQRHRGCSRTSRRDCGRGRMSIWEKSKWMCVGCIDTSFVNS